VRSFGADRHILRLAPSLIAVGIVGIVVLRFFTYRVPEELVLVVPIAVFGGAAVLRALRRRREGYGASALSDRMQTVARELRRWADGLENAETTGRNPMPPSDLLGDMIEDVQHLSSNRGRPQLQGFDLDLATPAALRSEAARLDQEAMALRAGPRPYAMEGRELAGCLTIPLAIGGGGAWAVWIHFHQALGPGMYLYGGTAALAVSAAVLALILYMQRQEA
jgi:hypothetical protein